MTCERDIVFEIGSERDGAFWVLAQPQAYTVFKTGNVASESVQSFARTEDGLSLAIAYARYKFGANQAKRDDGFQLFRTDRPEMFAQRILQYLSRYGGAKCWPIGLGETAHPGR